MLQAHEINRYKHNLNAVEYGDDVNNMFYVFSCLFCF